MAVSKELKDKIALASIGESELLDAFIQLWIESPGIAKEVFLSYIAQLETICEASIRGKAWITVSYAIYYSLWAGTGNPVGKLNEACELFKQCNDEAGEGVTLAFNALYYKDMGRLDKAQQCVNVAINKLKDYPKYLYFLGVAHFQGAEINQLLKDYDAALDYLKRGLVYFENDTGTFKARLLNATGNIHKHRNELDLALEYFLKSLKHIEGKSNPVMESKNYSDIGNYYLQTNKLEKALDFQVKSMEIRRKMNQTRALISNYIELSEIYLKLNDSNKALDNAIQAETLAEEHKIISQIYQTQYLLSRIYEKRGEFKSSLDHYKKYHSTKDQVTGQENARKIKQINMNHEMETVQKEKEIFELRNVFLKEALNEIEASVRYAKGLQEAILPSQVFINNYLPHNFIYYKPKDIVAGDFYWAEKLDDLFFVAAADSTGHGVPGAIVSVVCSNALNRTIKEFKVRETCEILNKARELVIETFEKSSNIVKDGMDISLLCIDLKNKNINWSGANNPLWYIQNNELKVIKADKQPIGKTDYPKSFTTHQIEYKENTIFYLFTDGLADQFGGPQGKKFKYKQFEELIFSIKDKPLNEQSDCINRCFEDWKGKLEQVDDVCVIGIKI